MAHASSASRGRGRANKKQISIEDQRFVERAMAALPTGASKEGNGFAEELQRFNYHANPYMRTLTKVLWSGYALSRGQVVECHTRFKQAHRDATMSNIDQVTVRTLEDAAAQLERAMAPDGSVSLFLGELRDSTMQRIWARVCETSMLPPPSFSRIYGAADGPSLAEIEAAEKAEMAELLKDGAEVEELVAPAEGADAGEPEAAQAADGANGAAEADSEARAADDDDDEGDDNAEAEASFELKVSRTASADQAAEHLMAAAAELLKKLREQSASGEVVVTLSVAGVGAGSSSGKKRRRRRRRRR